jgi:glutamate 5-kinase
MFCFPMPVVTAIFSVHFIRFLLARLQALLSSQCKIHNDSYLVLSPTQALYTADPRSHPDARPIRIVEHIDDLCVEIGAAGSWGTGGMATKIQARTRPAISTLLVVII